MPPPYIDIVAVVTYGSWVYNYLYISPLTLQLESRSSDVHWYNIMWYWLPMTCSRSVVSSTNQKLPWPPWYNWNIVESGVNRHTPVLLHSYSSKNKSNVPHICFECILTNSIFDFFQSLLMTSYQTIHMLMTSCQTIHRSDASHHFVCLW